MKRFLLPLLALTACASAIELQGDFKGPLGLQLYSLRETFKKDPTAALDQTKSLGFKYAELYSAIPVEPEKLKGELAARGITPISAHFSYDALKKDPSDAIKAATTLGLKYAGVAWITHKDGEFGEPEVKQAAADLNQRWARRSRLRGSNFFTTLMVTNFAPSAKAPAKTFFFDLLVKETNPELVAFEMWTSSGSSSPEPIP